jgi:hypothetical protein
MVDLAEVAVLFLDVDGTLIPIRRRPADECSTGGADESGSAMSAVNPLLTRLDPAHGARLSALDCDLVWATSWMDEANEEISPRLGLPVLPLVRWSDDAEDAITGRLHWKTQELVAWAAGRTFVWVDDEITQADRAWVAARHPGDALLHRVEANVGLTDSDFTAIERWLELRDQLVVPIRELCRRVQVLLDELCIDLGFCLSPVDQDRLRHEPPLVSDAFVDAVFIAEGLDPPAYGHLRSQVQQKVIDRMPDIASAYRQGGR